MVVEIRDGGGLVLAKEKGIQSRGLILLLFRQDDDVYRQSVSVIEMENTREGQEGVILMEHCLS
jgi:hypothetical protein